MFGHPNVLVCVRPEVRAETEEVAEDIEVWLDDKKSFAKMCKDGKVKNRMGALLAFLSVATRSG